MGRSSAIAEGFFVYGGGGVRYRIFGQFTRGALGKRGGALV